MQIAAVGTRGGGVIQQIGRIKAGKSDGFPISSAKQFGPDSLLGSNSKRGSFFAQACISPTSMATKQKQSTLEIWKFVYLSVIQLSSNSSVGILYREK